VKLLRYDRQPAAGVKGQSARALRLEPNTNGAPNVIGGASVNFVAPGVVGAVIAGGGATNYFGEALTNSIASSFSTIAGGRENTIEAYDRIALSEARTATPSRPTFPTFRPSAGAGATPS